MTSVFQSNLRVFSVNRPPLVKFNGFHLVNPTISTGTVAIIDHLDDLFYNLLFLDSFETSRK